MWPIEAIRFEWFILGRYSPVVGSEGGVVVYPISAIFNSEKNEAREKQKRGNRES